MNAQDQEIPDQATILKGAIIGGLINAVINGAIQYVILRGSDSIPLSVDAITNDAHTVFGAAVPLAVSLAMILTVVAYFSLKAPKKPFLPHALGLVIKHGLMSFGAIVAGAVVWQRAFGTVEVSLAAAILILGVLAGLVSAIVNYMTVSAVIERPA